MLMTGFLVFLGVALHSGLAEYTDRPLGNLRRSDGGDGRGPAHLLGDAWVEAADRLAPREYLSPGPSESQGLTSETEQRRLEAPREYAQERLRPHDPPRRSAPLLDLVIAAVTLEPEHSGVACNRGTRLGDVSRADLAERRADLVDEKIDGMRRSVRPERAQGLGKGADRAHAAHPRM